jgi:hypothetical protein
VYEPAVHLLGEVASATSRAAQPDLSNGFDGSLYHSSCFERRDPER